jgi:hypothetical protein
MAYIQRSASGDTVTPMQEHESDDREALRVRAYFLWLAEGRPEDRHVEHWLEAESSLQPAEDEPVTEKG